MLSMGIDVNLPRVKSKSVDVTEEKLVPGRSAEAKRNILK